MPISPCSVLLKTIVELLEADKQEKIYTNLEASSVDFLHNISDVLRLQDICVELSEITEVISCGRTSYLPVPPNCTWAYLVYMSTGNLWLYQSVISIFWILY